MKRRVPWVRGRVLAAIEHDRESQEWVLDFGDAHCLRVASAWRVVRDGEVRLGFEDDGHPFGLPEPVDGAARVRELVGERIVHDALVNSSGDLALDFGEGVRFEVFNDSCGYEGWKLHVGEKVLVAQGGGNVCGWPDEALGRLPPVANLAFCRWAAFVCALALIAAVPALNGMAERWQYAPLWIIDYVVAGCLLAGFWLTRRGRNLPVLMSAWALSTGVMYMALFVSLEPELGGGLAGDDPVPVAIGAALAVSIFGALDSARAWRKTVQA